MELIPESRRSQVEGSQSTGQFPHHNPGTVLSVVFGGAHRNVVIHTWQVLGGERVPSVIPPAQDCQPGLVPGFMKVVHTWNSPTSQKVLWNVPSEHKLVTDGTHHVQRHRWRPVGREPRSAGTQAASGVPFHHPSQPSSCRRTVENSLSLGGGSRGDSTQISKGAAASGPKREQIRMAHETSNRAPSELMFRPYPEIEKASDGGERKSPVGFTGHAEGGPSQDSNYGPPGELWVTGPCNASPDVSWGKLPFPFSPKMRRDGASHPVPPLRERGESFPRGIAGREVRPWNGKWLAGAKPRRRIRKAFKNPRNGSQGKGAPSKNSANSNEKFVRGLATPVAKLLGPRPGGHVLGPSPVRPVVIHVTGMHNRQWSWHPDVGGKAKSRRRDPPL